MGNRLTKQTRKDVKDICKLIRRLNCAGPKEFAEIARELGYMVVLEDSKYPEDATLKEVIDSFNHQQRKIVNFLVDQALRMRG